MSHRSAIGYKRNNGDIRAVYCHWGGLPRNQLPILNEHYNSLWKCKKLVRPGSMSVLRSNEDWDGNEQKPAPLYHQHNLNGPWRRKGCSYWEIPIVKSLTRALTFWRALDCEYLYVFDPSTNEWTATSLTQ